MVQFVLLGHPRSGSNLLANTLAGHPQVRMLNEVLHRDAEVRRRSWEGINPAAWVRPRGSAYQDGEDGAAFLRDRVFGAPYVRRTRACGFKLFYDNAYFDQSVETAWDYLASRSIRVINLHRRNLLDVVVSFAVAERTNRWFHGAGWFQRRPEVVPAFRLEPEYCKEFFDRVTLERARAEVFFAGHPMLRLTYEDDLVTDFKATMLRVCDFLEIKRLNLKPALLKQQQVGPETQIENFSELREHFANS